MENINQTDNLMYSACFLCTNTCFFDTPDCIGCSSNQKCLCVREEFCCRAGADNFGVGLSTDDDKSDICLLKLFCCTVGLTKNIADPICRQDAQECCIVGQAALPPDEKIPKAITMLFLTCWSEKGVSGCMKKWGEF